MFSSSPTVRCPNTEGAEFPKSLLLPPWFLKSMATISYPREENVDFSNQFLLDAG